MRNFWTKEKCKLEALKYEYRSEFQKNNRSAYNASIRQGILNDVCSHMKNVGHLYKRCIYAYEFEDNCVYVGLTFNLDKRHKYHLKRGTVYEHIIINHDFILKQLTDYIDIKIAKEKENEYIEEYRIKGCIILNKAKAGSVGSKIKYWTFDKCKEEATKYSTRYEFQKKSGGAYNSAFLNNWIDDICTHMKSRIWTKETCKEEALKYNSKIEYRKNSSGSYSSALRNKWIDDVCSHMTPLMKRNYWTFDKCKEEALKYTNKTDFFKNSGYVYKLSRKNKWIKQICIYMK